MWLSFYRFVDCVVMLDRPDICYQYVISGPWAQDVLSTCYRPQLLSICLKQMCEQHTEQRMEQGIDILNSEQRTQ